MNKIINWKRQFVVIYTGQAFSILGSAAVQFAIIWWLTVQTESAVTLTIASVVAFLPNMLIGPFAGVWVDRYNRRTVMIAADGLVAVSSAILGVAFWLVPTPPFGLYTSFYFYVIGQHLSRSSYASGYTYVCSADMLTNRRMGKYDPVDIQYDGRCWAPPHVICTDCCHHDCGYTGRRFCHRLSFVCHNSGYSTKQ